MCSSDLLKVTREQIFLALAKDIPAGEGKLIPNPHKTWKDVDPSLPDTKIEVLGPPPTSGTRDAFAELALEGGCKKIGWIKAMKKKDKKKYKAICHSVREDGAYVEAGENDVLIVRKLEANPNAFGVFGFSFLDQNADKLKGAIDRIPTPVGRPRLRDLLHTVKTKVKTAARDLDRAESLVDIYLPFIADCQVT